MHFLNRYSYTEYQYHNLCCGGVLLCLSSPMTASNDEVIYQHYLTPSDAIHPRPQPRKIRSRTGTRYHPCYGLITVIGPPGNQHPPVITSMSSNSNPRGRRKARNNFQPPLPLSTVSFGLHTPPTTPHKKRPKSTGGKFETRNESEDLIPTVNARPVAIQGENPAPSGGMEVC